MSVLIADDSEEFRKALRRRFEGQSEIIIVGEAVDFSHASRLAGHLRPDVVLLDLRMKDSHGLDAVTAAPALISNGATILAMSFNTDDDAKALAKQIGAAKLMDKMTLSVCPPARLVRRNALVEQNDPVRPRRCEHSLFSVMGQKLTGRATALVIAAVEADAEYYALHELGFATVSVTTLISDSVYWSRD